MVACAAEDGDRVGDPRGGPTGDQPHVLEGDPAVRDKELATQHHDRGTDPLWQDCLVAHPTGNAVPARQGGRPQPPGGQGAWGVGSTAQGADKEMGLLLEQ